MAMRKLSYFVFTSGEEGIHGTDYGIKFASDVFGDHRQLDASYRDLLEGFGLQHGLECPESGVGILLLQWRQKLMVFVFPGKDFLGRPKTAAVAFSIPADIAASFTPRETARRIWSANDVPGIARRDVVRPDAAVFPDEAAPEGNYPFVSSSALLKWPDDDRAYFSINRNIREILRQKEKQAVNDRNYDSRKKNLPKILWIAAGVMIAIVAGIYPLSDLQQDMPTPRENITVTGSEDSQPGIYAPSSPDIMPEISPDATENILTLSSTDSADITAAPNKSDGDIVPLHDEIDSDGTRQALYDLLKPLYGKTYIDSDDSGVKISVRNIPSNPCEKLRIAHKTGYYSGISGDVMSRLWECLRPEYYHEKIKSIVITLDPDENLPAEIKSRDDFDECINIFVEQILQNKKGESR